jgi:hypothetical protein
MFSVINISLSLIRINPPPPLLLSLSALQERRLLSEYHVSRGKKNAYDPTRNLPPLSLTLSPLWSWCVLLIFRENQK